MAMQPMAAETPAAPQRGRSSQMNDPKAYERWQARFKDAATAREEEARKVWTPLYDGLLGSLLRGEGDADPLNGFSQFCDMVMPHLEGDQREVLARPTRISLGEDAAGKMQFAKMLGDQATALAQNCGFYVDEMGRPGEWVHALYCHLFSCGVLLFGFEPPRGQVPVEIEQDGETVYQMVDIDRATAEGRERADAGMPWVRSYDPRRVLFDGTFNDIARGAWVAFDSYMTLAAAKARWPEYADRLKKTHDSVPDCGADSKGEKRGDDEGLIRVRYTYVRDPLRLLVIPDPGAGVAMVLEETELDLGIEGLPVLVLGAKWLPGRLYPKPAMAEVLGPANVEKEHARVVRGMVSKIKTVVLVQDANLAAQLRSGDPQGVYTVPETLRGAPPDQIVANVQVGGVPREHIDLKHEAREDLERNTGMADMALGRREPGNPTATEAANRQNAVTVRMQGLLKPARIAEAEACKRLTAIAYAKIDWLHGMAMPLGQGQNARFAYFDANRPVIGEIIDYAFEMQVADAVTRADEAYAANTAAGTLMQLDPLLQQRGQTVAWEVLAQTLAESSGLRRGGELIVPLPPPPPQQQMGQPGMESAGEPAEADPQAQLEQLYQMLEQTPEGSPEEEQIMQQIAALTAGMQQQQGVAA